MLEKGDGGRVEAHGGDLVPVDGWTILRSSSLVVAAMGLSYMVGDGQTGSILLVSMRATIQLLVLGQILVPIFQYGHEHWWAPVLYILAMSLIAAQAALGRPKYVYPHIALHFTAGLVTTPLLAAVFVVGPVLKVDPLWEPQYCIPLTGMILNNAISVFSLPCAVWGLIFRVPTALDVHCPV
jgi:putative ABC transport system permease protein